jgi:probable HAF family extracellular repeat protein
MKTKHNLIKTLSSIALAACCAFGVSSAGAQTANYIVTDLGVLPDQKDSAPAAINDQGQVAGTSGFSAFRYTSDRKDPMEDVARHSAKGISRGFGINGTGVVVGDSTFGKDFSHAAVFSNGSATDLGTIKGGGDYSRANGINVSGQVVGFASEKPDFDNGRAFIVSTFDRRGMIDLGTLGGIYAQAWGVNDSGFVTGNSQIKSGYGITHAFIWEKRAGMVDLGTLAGDFSYGTFINANNHVVGYSTIDKNNDRVHAFLHDGKEMLDLGSLGGASMESDRSFALGVNSSDQVVGYSYLPALTRTPRQVAFVYSEGKMMNLNDLIGSMVEKYRLDSATAINEKGQIVAVAFVNSVGVFHAVLLTPATNGDSTTELDRAGSPIKVNRATYSVTYGVLTVQVTYVVAPSTTRPVLSVYESANKNPIGTLKTKDGSSYFGSFSMKGNPQKIFVADNTGKYADAEVEEIK